MCANNEKTVQQLKPIAPISIHPMLDLWNQKRFIWAKLEITSPLCSVQWSETTSVLEMVHAHANAVIKLMGTFEKGETILSLWESVHLAMGELFEALINLKYQSEELNTSTYMSLLVRVQMEFEHTAWSRNFLTIPMQVICILIICQY